MKLGTITRRDFGRGLSLWYRRNRRELPWRVSRDPYRVWVSEIMLQQTQVKTVVPYFKRWMRRFPTVQSLARADIGSALKEWEGLGYYQRARNLHSAAKTVVSDHGGRFPREFDAVLALPGIGRYTAGAICSIAFGQRAPVLDGNVTRVLSRYFGIRDSVRSPLVQRRLWTLAEALLPAKNTGDFNEAMMELGATVCLPLAPECARCPLRRGCRALRKGNWESIPNTGSRIATEKRARIAAVVHHPRRPRSVLLCHGTKARLLEGLWSFPTVEAGRAVCRKSDVAIVERRFEESLGLRLRLSKPLLTIHHTVTRYRITLTAWEAVAEDASMLPLSVSGSDWRWISERQLRSMAVDAATRKVLRAVGMM